MMSYLFYLFFLIPMFFFNFWYFYQFFYMFFIFIFIFINSSLSFSSLNYLFGVDFISYVLVVLSFYIISLMSLASSSINNSIFFCFINYLIALMLFIIFSSVNMLVMYISFEFVLLPLFTLILGWGQYPERLSSGFYLFFFTLFGSLPLFLMIIYFYFDLMVLSFFFELSFSFNFFLHLFMVLPFLISLPIFMLHFWLPKAHVQAPISGSMILAGVMLKIGGYGLIRFIYLNDYYFYNYSYIWFSFGLLGSLMVGFICLVQVDIKCLIAYSSVAHMSMCLLGILTMTNLGVYGCLIMMVSHGLCSSGLFCLANICYLRLNTRSLYLTKGLVSFMPSLSFFWFLFSGFNMGCPPSINFMSELCMIISSLYYFNFSYLYLILSCFISACFSFYMYSFSQHGIFNSIYSHSSVSVSEFLLLVCHLYPLVSLMFLFMLL
uniref:NADH dehydrogenase subunit 4 n=1 Tax=Anchon yunnanense TaxID=2885775 RepID=UPI001EE0BC56|nr:NADH dehydrogenase subunit 4 [Anchon yunnanense]UKB86904.1 NADH dehydrogenase subunit 4 [Anchon yunnanense]